MPELDLSLGPRSGERVAEGRVRGNRTRTMTNALTGKNTRNEYFERHPRPIAMPRTIERFHVGASSHQSNVSSATAIIAATGESVVTIPAWPRSGGSEAYIAIASTPATCPK